MRVSVGVFDLFAYAIPGGLYLFFGVYVAVRLEWVALSRLDDPPAVLLAGAVVVVSYLLGQVTYSFGTLLDRVTPWRRTWVEARREFVRRVPQADERPYVHVHPSVLASAVESRDRELALDIHRFRAVGLMVRNCAFPLLCGAAAGVVEAVAGGPRDVAVVCAVALAAAAVAALAQAAKLRYWADLKTLEVCYWLPDVDAAFAPEPRRRSRLPWRH